MKINRILWCVLPL